MKVSLNLIKQLTRVKLGNEELLTRINSRLAEVEGVEKLADKYQGILVAEIKEAKDHPDADKLGIYQVFNGKDTIQVVAGDKTLKVGDKVAHIAPGLTVPSTFETEEPFVLEARKLRGEMSNGMLGSAKELNFGDDHESVLVLDTDKPAGTTLIEAYDLDDLIIEVENKTLTHRPDAFGLIGFAREIAGIQDLKFKTPNWYLDGKAWDELPAGKQLSLKVDNHIPKDCPTYQAVVMSDVKIKPSTVQMQSYLSRVGMKPISNIVDMTNYQMMMTGQPLHAFDFDKVAGGKITIRYPKKGERLKLLDGRDIEIHAKAATICDENGPIALGGIMGGANSEIDENTKNIVVEAANFDMYSVRKTSMAHGIFSDAATRFMRGQSPEAPGHTIFKAVGVANDVSGAKVAGEIVGEYKECQREVIEASVNKINGLLGIEMDGEDMQRMLSNVELDAKANGDNLKVVVPFWRKDLNIWQDIAEEIGRLGGYDSVPATLPARDLTAVDYKDLEKLKKQIQSILVSAGANEVFTYSGVSQKLMDKVNLPTEQLYRIRNSLSSELEYMRGSLLPSLMSKVYLNHRRGYGALALFEVGKIHTKKDIGKDSLPVEHERVALVFSADKKTTEASYGGYPFYQAKLYLTHLLDALGVEGYRFEEEETQKILYASGVLMTKRRAKVMVAGKTLGAVGEFTHGAHTGLKLPDFSAGFEVDLTEILTTQRSAQKYKKLPKFPGIEHDVTFETPQEVSFQQVVDVFIKNIQGEDLQVTLTPTDTYQKYEDSLTRNITFRLNLVNTRKTMSAEEINNIVDGAVVKTEKTMKLKRV